MNQKELNKVFPLTDSSRKVPCIAKLNQERKSDGNLAKNPPKLCWSQTVTMRRNTVTHALDGKPLKITEFLKIDSVMRQ